jgi:hypothetical protein
MGQTISSASRWASRQRDYWRLMAEDRLRKLQRLEVGWDGHTGRPVAVSTVYFVLDVLEQIMLPGVPMPSLMPLSNGGLQIEWHRNGWDVEIEVARPNHLHFWAYDISGDREHEFDVSEDIAPLFEFVSYIAD